MAPKLSQLDEEDRHGLVLCLGISALIAGAWIYLGAEPHDLSAYRYGAALFWEGENPYLQANMAPPHYQGYPYVYLPFTRWLIAPLALIPGAGWLILLSLARMCSIAIAARTAVKALSLPIKWPSLFLLASALFHPFFIDNLTGNIATVFLGLLTILWLFLTSSNERGDGMPAPSLWKEILLGLTLGLVFSVKPTWLLPVMILTLGSRRLVLSGTLLAASGLAFGYSYFGSGMWGDWVALMKGIDTVWPSHDLFNISPPLFVIAAACWGLLGIKTMREGEPTSLLILASSSIVAWPRQSNYSFVLLFFATLYLIKRIGWPRGAIILLPVITPLPWIMRMKESYIFGMGILPLWGTVVGLLAIALLLKPEDAGSRESEEAAS